MRARLFLVPLLLGGLTGCQSFKERLFSPLTKRLDLVNSQLGETNRQLMMVHSQLGETNHQLVMVNDHLGTVNTQLDRPTPASATWRAGSSRPTPSWPGCSGPWGRRTRG